ncbi:unnamed protein product [Meloidogyne enterolobii]|uniref:Uncharacterized protein n=1 Tax=Meloidogyne enterolobii TaxID=390850 RepID=A0ACB1AH36_MELEN
MNWHKIHILQRGRFVSTQNLNFSLHQSSQKATFSIKFFSLSSRLANFLFSAEN